MIEMLYHHLHTGEIIKKDPSDTFKPRDIAVNQHDRNSLLYSLLDAFATAGTWCNDNPVHPMINENIQQIIHARGILGRTAKHNRIAITISEFLDYASCFRECIIGNIRRDYS